ncbi:hypothetical protein SCUCBS95973_007904 [Sporothrix curviconia]|uniref:Uncharacterized protein n=1 Tax=Sporothrix curviconia TaxID=1260050 RepID=A0ABP0CK26_9PEZI
MDQQTDKNNFSSTQGAAEALPEYSEFATLHNNHNSQPMAETSVPDTSHAANNPHGMLRVIRKAIFDVYNTALPQETLAFASCERAAARRIAHRIIEVLLDLHFVLDRLNFYGRAETANMVVGVVVEANQQWADYCAEHTAASSKAKKAVYKTTMAGFYKKILYSALGSKYPRQYQTFKSFFCAMMLKNLIKHTSLFRSGCDTAFKSPQFLQV